MIRNATWGAVAALMLNLAACAPAVAQAGQRVTRSPDDLLAAFAAEHRNEQTGGGTNRDVNHILTYPEDYPPADLEAFLDGLERLAIEGETPRLRSSAAFTISLPGSRHTSHPVSGTVPRLERIYARTTDQLVRAMVVAGMANVAEQKQALTFLERIAIQDPAEADFPGSASRALNSIWAMGAEGRRVLERLHTTGAVRDPKARHELSVVAERGYRLN